MNEHAAYYLATGDHQGPDYRGRDSSTGYGCWRPMCCERRLNDRLGMCWRYACSGSILSRLRTQAMPVATLLHMLGIRWTGLLRAIVLPLALTAVLFLGSIVMWVADWRTYGKPLLFDSYRGKLIRAAVNLRTSVAESLHIRLGCTFGAALLSEYFIRPPHSAPCLSPADVIVWRNYVVGPLTEEFAFRSCMLPLLLTDGVAPHKAVLVTPLLFGAAHMHHIYDLVAYQGFAGACCSRGGDHTMSAVFEIAGIGEDGIASSVDREQ